MDKFDRRKNFTKKEGEHWRKNNGLKKTQSGLAVGRGGEKNMAGN